MNNRLWLTMVLCLPLAAACQQFDSTASSQDPPLDFGSVPDPGNNTIPAQTSTPEILLPDGTTTTNACDKVKADAKTILQSHCAVCHEGSSSVMGKPLNFIMETDQLLSSPPTPNTEWVAAGLTSYVKAGDPDHSLVYWRAAIKGDMPKTFSDVRLMSVPATTLSENSVLRQWIAACM